MPGQVEHRLFVSLPVENNNVPIGGAPIIPPVCIAGILEPGKIGVLTKPVVVAHACQVDPDQCDVGIGVGRVELFLETVEALKLSAAVASCRVAEVPAGNPTYIVLRRDALVVCLGGGVDVGKSGCFKRAAQVATIGIWIVVARHDKPDQGYESYRQQDVFAIFHIILKNNTFGKVKDRGDCFF